MLVVPIRLLNNLVRRAQKRCDALPRIIVQYTIDEGVKGRDAEIFRTNEEARGEASWATASPSCAARVMQDECESKSVWAVTYEMRHHGLNVEYLSQTEMAIGRPDSCRAATNCSMFPWKGPDGSSPSTKTFCRLGNTVILPPTSSCNATAIPAANSLDR